MKMSGDTIESLIRERRKTEKESKLLQAQIDRLEAEKLEKDDEGTLEALSSQIEKLSFEKREKAKKLKDICRIARTISAGDYYYRYSGSIPLFQMGYYPSCCLSC